MTDHPRVDALFVTTMALFFGSLCPALMTFCYDFTSFTVICILFGLSLSAWPAVTSSMLVTQHLSVESTIMKNLTCRS